MWNAKEIQVSKFVEAQDLRLPRFQRKSTWNEKKDFYLALSFFRGLPLGMIVIKDPSTNGSISERRYLLDGRQRWEALKGLRDPETVYRWAKAAIRIRSSWSEAELAAAFRREVENYFGADPAEHTLDGDGFPEEAGLLETDRDDLDDEADDFSPATSGSAFAPLVEVNGYEPAQPGLDELLDILLLVHPQRARGSRFTKAFVYWDLVPRLPFVERDPATDRPSISPSSLREWIAFRSRIAGAAGRQVPPTQDEFLLWLTDGQELDPRDDDALRARIQRNWGTIEAAIRLNRRLEQRLEQSVIAALILTGTSAAEDAKIFEIINTGGTKLTAAEVLSATPQWSKSIESPHPQLVSDAMDLYSAMGVESEEGVVRWDVPATLLSRLDMPQVLGTLTGKTPRDDTRRFERRITLGFQLLSGWYQRKIAKDFVESLPRAVPEIPWGTATLDGLLNDAVSVASNQDQFRYWAQWKLSIIDLMSDAVALNFILSLALDWDRKGRPRVDGAELKAYRRNARTLLDRSIYEYCTGRWRGSSDSRIAANLALITPSQTPAFEPVPESDWERLMHEIVDDGTILGSDYTARVDPRIRLLLGYRNVVARLWPSVTHREFSEVDHIIPSSEFVQVPATSPVRSIEHHITNLALLPASVNRAKSDRPLNRIPSMADRQLVAQYEDVPVDKFDDFSSVDNAVQLKEHRGPILIGDLTVTRSDRLAN